MRDAGAQAEVSQSTEARGNDKQIFVKLHAESSGLPGSPGGKIGRHRIRADGSIRWLAHKDKCEEE